MSQTKKIAISSMLVALSTVFMVLGAVIEVFDLTVCAMASLIVVLVYIEMGSPYTWLVWICTSLATALMFPGSLIWLEYLLVFGIYPLIKAYIERLPRWSWIPVRLIFINSVVWALILLCDLVLGIPFFGSEAPLMKIVIYVLINVAFIAYDAFITIMVRFYMVKLRDRFKRFFK